MKDYLQPFILLLLVMAVAVMVLGCQPFTAQSNAPGTITHQKDSRQWTFGVTPLVIDGQAAALVIPSSAKQVVEQTRVVQPENASGGATMDASAKGTRASIPASYKLSGPATPTQVALGGLVWLGAILVSVGAIGMGLRLSPWSFGKIVPVGVSVLIAAAGGLLIAYATVLASAPWWLTALCIGAVITLGVVIAVRDNWKKLQPVAAKLQTLTGSV